MIHNRYYYILAILFVVFLMWLFYGGKKHEYIGIDFFNVDRIDINKLEKYNKHEAEKLRDLRQRNVEVTLETLHRKSFKQRSKGETICKDYLEKKFKVPFVSERPDWLKNPLTGSNLELDLYNKDLKLAVEYNGIQHYKFPNRYHTTEDQFEDQKIKDRLKEQMCKDQGVDLIVVPYDLKDYDIPIHIYKNLPLRLK